MQQRREVPVIKLLLTFLKLMGKILPCDWFCADGSHLCILSMTVIESKLSSHKTK